MFRDACNGGNAGRRQQKGCPTSQETTNYQEKERGKEVKVERKTKNYYESSDCHSHMTPGLARLCIP